MQYCIMKIKQYNIIGKQSKQRINSHIDKQCRLLTAISIVTVALTPTECLLGVEVGVEVEGACKASKIM